MTLPRCADAPDAGPVYCGRLERPLDPDGTVAGRLAIYFELYPHTGPGKAVGMLVATEGARDTPPRNPARNIWRCSSRCAVPGTC